MRVPRVLLFALLALAVSSRPRAAAQEPPVFGSDLDVVYVTVSVHDGEGEVVTDLGPEDFLIFEDGRPQQLLRIGDGKLLFARAVEPGAEDLLSLDLGLLMDTSKSMVPNLKLSRLAAVRFLDAVPRARELFTVFFDEEIRVSRYDSENQQGLAERINEVTGGRNTCLYDAIAVYLSRIQGSQGRKVLVLFSDGEDSRSELTQGEVSRLIQASPVTIYAIAFAPDGAPSSSRAVKGRQVLRRLVETTGGAVFVPDSYRDLPEIYTKILQELSGQYVLGFVSDRPENDGRYRKLKVEVARKGLKVRHRSGYYPRAAAESADNRP